MRALVAISACLIAVSQQSPRGEGRIEILRLPHALRPGETAWLELTLGAVVRGTEIKVATTSGQLLGVVSPFGIRAGREAGTYTVPIPIDAIAKNRVSLRLSIERSGHAPRAPSAKELKRVRVKIMPAADSRSAAPPPQP